MKRLVEVHGERWDFIASHFPDRADVQCQHRWQKVVNPELVKGEFGGNYVGWGHLLLGEARGHLQQESCVHRIIFGVFLRTLDQRGR